MNKYDAFFSPNKGDEFHKYHQKEEITKQELIQKLSPYFDIQQEVWDFDEKNRIDLIITHKKYPEYPFGIEVKREGKKTGKDIGAFIFQGAKYSRLYWKNVGKIPIFLFPHITNKYLREGDMMAKHREFQVDNNISTFIGYFHLGELKMGWGDFGETIQLEYQRKILWELGLKGEYINKENFNKSWWN
jgi:hypothetical protein